MTSVAEQLVLDGVALNDVAGDFVLIDGTLSMPPPAKRPMWVQAADADGSALIDDPRFENRTVQFDLRVNRIRTTPAATMDDVLGLIAKIAGKLEEAEKQPGGLPLVWTPANSANSVTFYVLTGTVDDVPITVTGDTKGWFRKYPRFKVTLTCKPFGYGAEVTAGTTGATTALAPTLTLASVAGDVPAEARLIVTEGSAQSRRHLEWGIEQRYYNAATALELDSASLVTSGFAGTSTTRSGSENTNVIRGALVAQAVAVAGTGVQAHVGTFRVKARVYATSTVLQARLSWQDGDGPFRANTWAQPPLAFAWTEIDLGVIDVSSATLGTQKWSGRIEALSTASGDTLDIDYLLFIPAGEGYGKARAAYTYAPGSIIAHDDFTGMTGGAALNARSSPAGGNWATSGDAADFTASSTPADHTSGTGMSVKRSSSTDAAQGRLAVLGTTTFTDTEVGAYVQTSGANSAGDAMGVVARYVDASNYLRGYVDATSLNLVTRVAGTETVLAQTTLAGTQRGDLAWLGVKLVVFASGICTVTATDTTGTVIVASILASSSVLATGGALASGKPGLQDRGGVTGNTHSYDDFYVATPNADPIVCYASRQIEVRSDDTLRQDATGTYYGRVPRYRGSRFFLQPAGDAGRTSRVIVKARRNDVDTAADDVLHDSMTVAVKATPRYLAVPHT